MSSKKDISNRTFIDQMHLQTSGEESQTFDVYELEPDLPKNSSKREECLSHFSYGADSELISDFYLGGVDFPKKDQSPEITLQFSCKGVSCILKRCGLTITQYDSSGKVVSEMSAPK